MKTLLCSRASGAGLRMVAICTALLLGGCDTDDNGNGTTPVTDVAADGADVAGELPGVDAPTADAEVADAAEVAEVAGTDAAGDAAEAGDVAEDDLEDAQPGTDAAIEVQVDVEEVAPGTDVVQDIDDAQPGTDVIADVTDVQPGTDGVADVTDTQPGTDVAADVIDVPPAADILPDVAGKPCTSVEQCPISADPCVTKVCQNNLCGFQPVANGSACTDGNECTIESCQAGKCVGQGELGIKTLPGPGGGSAAWAVMRVGQNFALAGEATPTGATLPDAWLVTVDPTGKVLTSHTYGGPGIDVALDATMVGDSGFVLAGHTEGDPGKKSEAWVVRVDTNGEIVWQRTWGGNDTDEFHAIRANGSGGFVAAGRTRSKGTGKFDAWLVGFDATGDVLWEATYGNGGDDRAQGVAVLPDGGYVVVGAMVASGSAQEDLWVARTDNVGKVLWQKTFGGTAPDRATALLAIPGGGILVIGHTESKGFGKADFWLLRLDDSGTLLFDKTYGGAESEKAENIVALSDGGYALVGSTSSFGDGKNSMWLVRTDSDGNMHWNHAYGGIDTDRASDVVELDNDAGFIVAGDTFDATAKQTVAAMVHTNHWGSRTCKTQGKCLALKLQDCDDSLPCTYDDCNGEAGCVNAFVPNGMMCGTTKTCLNGACP